MTSDRKAETNRQNALKSIGPKTPEGRAAVRHAEGNVHLPVAVDVNFSGISREDLYGIWLCFVKCNKRCIVSERIARAGHHRCMQAYR
jgi:hypothetical protein